jgi:hypothetical protein
LAAGTPRRLAPREACDTLRLFAEGLVVFFVFDL